jgi:hypothetical protein
MTYAPDYPEVAIGPDVWFTDDAQAHTLRVQAVEENGQTRITAWLNGNFMLSVLDSTFAQGTFGFLGGFVSNAIEVREVEMFFLPLEEDFIDIQGAS